MRLLCADLSAICVYAHNQNVTFDLKNINRVVSRKFPLGEHHDTHEATIFILDILETVVNIADYTMIFNTTLKCTLCDKNISTERGETCCIVPVSDNLSTSINSKYLTPTTLHDYTCDQCNVKGTVIETDTITHFPKQLIFTINRFSYDGNKIDNPMSFYESFKFQRNETVYEYDLHTVVYHYGTTNGGHYNVIVKKNNKLYLIDDETITHTSEFIINNAYMLFYTLSRTSKMVKIMVDSDDSDNDR